MKSTDSKQNNLKKSSGAKQEKQENRDFFWYNSDQDERDARTEVIENLNRFDSKFYFDRDSRDNFSQY